MHILVDGDIVAYKIASRCEHVTQWEEDNVSITSDLGEIREAFEQYTANLLANHCESYTICLSSPDRRYWRHDIYPTYKAARPSDVRKVPTGLKYLREEIMRPLSKWKQGLEADDVLGILATSKKLIKGPRAIASLDKDFKQIPGVLMDPFTFATQTISPEDADLFHMMQTLTGDITDGYPGCPGIGPVKASKLLAGLSAKDRWKIIVETYAKKNLTEQDALVMARISRILRVSDFDFKTNTPKLWSPPQ